MRYSIIVGYNSVVVAILITPIKALNIEYFTVIFSHSQKYLVAISGHISMCVVPFCCHIFCFYAAGQRRQFTFSSISP